MISYVTHGLNARLIQKYTIYGYISSNTRGRDSGAILVSKTGCKRSVSGTRICGYFAGKASQKMIGRKTKEML